MDVQTEGSIIACHHLANTLTRSALRMEASAKSANENGWIGIERTLLDGADDKRHSARDLRRRACELGAIGLPPNATESAASLS